MLIAITRQVGPTLADCEISFQDRQPIDVPLAMRQHAAYRDALSELGVHVVDLPALPDYPDCVFVEDPVLILDEVAIVTRMGAESRRGESPSLAAAVERYRDLLHFEAPATLEGGDVMRIGKTLYVGLSQRTNIAGIQQLAQLTAPFGYWVTPVELRGCLHLKSAVCHLGGNTVLANRAWLDLDGFCGLTFIDVPASEPNAGNVLRIGDTILMPSSYPETRALLEANGFNVRTVDISELIKAEAGVTCLSLLFEARQYPEET
jgi:dimethylargininase